MDLNHILLFLAVISPLVVLARTWRPGAQHHGWRIAAFVVLAITAIAWFLVPRAAGYIGGLAWIALLFLPAIGLRKMTELAAQADYKSAAKLGEILQILHPSAELRDQVRLFRHLQSQRASFEGGIGTPLAQRQSGSNRPAGASRRPCLRSRPKSSVQSTPKRSGSSRVDCA